MVPGTLLQRMGAAVLVGLIVLVAPTTGATAAVTTHHRVAAGAAQPGANQHPVRAQHFHAAMHQKVSPHHELAALMPDTVEPPIAVPGEVADVAVLISDVHSLNPLGRGPPAL